MHHAFKTPTLRPPYFHDGSAANRYDVIKVYEKGGIDRPWSHSCRWACQKDNARRSCWARSYDWYREDHMALRRFIIERDIPKVGTFEREQLRGAAAKSNDVLRQLGPDIQWIESYVANDKTFCVYLAKDESVIRQHAEISGFPATRITEIRTMIDPTTERAG
jgi:hypothetical protein